MSIIDPPKSRFLFGLIVGAAIAVTGAAVLQNLALRKQRTHAAAYLLEGYDFGDLRNNENIRGGPRIGEKINLANLIGRKGATLENTIEKRPAMIATVSPSCGFCKTARDEMQYVQGQIALKNIRYYLVSFAPPGTDSDFYGFCDTLKIGAPAFGWSKDVTPPQEALSKMVTPSHLRRNYSPGVARDFCGAISPRWHGASDR